MPLPPPDGGPGEWCFEWGGERWGKNYPDWHAFRQWLIDHGAVPNVWIDSHPAAAACIEAVRDAPPPSPPPSPPPPGGKAKQKCFEWGGRSWGKDYPGWAVFKKWLFDHNADPDEWITSHPAAAKCIAANTLAKCFEWGGKSWGKDYPGWDAFAAWLRDHNSDEYAWILAHPEAAKCIGAPTPPGGGPPGGPPPPPPPPVPPPGGPPVPPYNVSVGPFAGRGVYTTTDPLSALKFGSGIQWVAVMPDATSPAQVDQLKAAGYTVVAWEGDATAGGVAFALAHCSGYIGQAEGPGQLADSVAQTGALGSFPKALVSNNFMDAYPAGWVAQPEAYGIAIPKAPIGAAVQDALNRGATVVVPVVGLSSDSSGGWTAAQYLADADAMGITSIAAFSAESMSPADIATWSTEKPPSPGAPGGGGAGAPPPGQAEGGPPAKPTSGAAYFYTHLRDQLFVVVGGSYKEGDVIGYVAEVAGVPTHTHLGVHRVLGPNNVGVAFPNAAGPVHRGEKPAADFKTDHPTAGLDGYPAHDFPAPYNAQVLCVEAGTVTRISGHTEAQGNVDKGANVYGKNVFLDTAGHGATPKPGKPPPIPPSLGGPKPAPAGIVKGWRNLLDAFRIDLPKQREAALAVLAHPKELFK